MSIKVLVADDSITIQKVIGIIFGGDEYSLTVVDNGKAAVEKACEINPDILLIDALMPGMTGYEVAEAVRSIPALAGKPILILTGSFEPFDEEKAKKCGADDFIAKPFESQQIITKVKELLDLGKTRTPSAQATEPPAPETAFEQAPEAFTPVSDIAAPAFAQQPEAPNVEAPADIWGAFTPEVEQPPVEVASPAVTAATDEPDVFAIVSEENEAQIVQPTTEAVAPNHTGSQWVPVEENTFEFEEVDELAQPPQEAFAEQTVAVQETAFGEIAFEEEVAAPIDSSLAAFAPLEDVTPPAPEPAAVTEVAIAIPAVSLTEEQLKAAIMAASKDVIERIVWEVVPDLAEVMVREAIRKIKEGA